MAVQNVQTLDVNCTTNQVTVQTVPDPRPVPVPTILDVAAITAAKLTEPGTYRLAQILGYVP